MAGIHPASTIRILSDDSFEGRGPATAGETKTVQYLTQQFQAAGLQPGGEVVNGQRQWTQRVPLLKSDIVGDPRASVIDIGMTRVVDHTLAKVVSWYDNEWGFAHQMIREARAMLAERQS